MFKRCLTILLSLPGILEAQTVITAPASLMQDFEGDIYSVTFSEPYTIAHIGTPPDQIDWEITRNNFLVFDINCSEPDRIFLHLDGFTALDRKTGLPIWNLPDIPSNSLVTCALESPYLLIQKPDNMLLAVDKKDGSILWTSERFPFFSHISIEREVAYISARVSGQLVVEGVDLQSGAGLWTREIPTTVYYNYLSRNRFFTFEKDTASLVDPKTGETAWTYTAEGLIPYAHDAHTATYFVSKNQVAWVNDSTGAVVWSHPIAENTAVTLLSSNRILLITSGESTSDVTVLDSQTGARLWQKTYPFARAFPYEDKQGEVFLVNQSTVQSIDEANGSILWSYTRVLDEVGERIATVFDSDSANVYVRYALGNGRIPAGGVIALDRNSGRVNWDFPVAESFNTGPLTESYIFLSLPTKSLAILKDNGKASESAR